MAGFSTQKTMGGLQKKIRLNEEVELYEFPADEWITVRYLGTIRSWAEMWPKIKTDAGKITSIPKFCSDYDETTQTYKRNKCPYRRAGIYVQQQFADNMIVRDLQEDKPRRIRKPSESERKRVEMPGGARWRVKKAGSKTWTPVRAHKMPSGLAQKLAERSQINKYKGKAYDITDPKYGIDMLIRYNPKKAGAAKWDVERGERTPLTKEERNYCLQDLRNLKSIKPERLSEAKADWKRLKEKYVPDEKPEYKKYGKSSSKRRDRDEEKRPSKRRERDRDHKSSKVKNKSSKRRKIDFRDDEIPF